MDGIWTPTSVLYYCKDVNYHEREKKKPDRIIYTHKNPSICEYLVIDYYTINTNIKINELRLSIKLIPLKCILLKCSHEQIN